MKHLLSNMMLAGFALTVLAAQPAAAAPGKLCLNLRDIASTDANREGTAITFKMRDGAVYRNDLKGVCSDLKYDGFVWSFPGPDMVCENEQTLKVIHSGQFCQLGKFTQMTPAR